MYFVSNKKRKVCYKSSLFWKESKYLQVQIFFMLMVGMLDCDKWFFLWSGVQNLSTTLFIFGHWALETRGTIKWWNNNDLWHFLEIFGKLSYNSGVRVAQPKYSGNLLESIGQWGWNTNFSKVLTKHYKIWITMELNNVLDRHSCCKGFLVFRRRVA